VTYVIGSVPLFEVTLECLEIGHSRLGATGSPQPRPANNTARVGALYERVAMTTRRGAYAIRALQSCPSSWLNCAPRGCAHAT
jgi:hypothetical protein